MNFIWKKKNVLRLILPFTALIIISSLKYTTILQRGYHLYSEYSHQSSKVFIQNPCQKNFSESEQNMTTDINQCKFSVNRSTEVRHIAFLKVHKCASSSVLNILYRFGLQRNLNFVLPIRGNYLDFGSKRGTITEIPPPFNGDYDILCNHVFHFRKSIFEHYLPADTVYIAIVREPLQRMQSAFNYYRNIIKVPHLRSITGANPFKTYLKHPNYYESKWTYHSNTNNNMAKDFGFSYNDFKNVAKFRKYLQVLDKTFHLVMVREMFDESLVLMRRMLNWSMKDILGLTQNAHPTKPIPEADVTSKLSPFLALDRILYDHFSEKLKGMISSEGEGFQEEVAYFRKLNERTSEFCRTNSTHKKMKAGSSAWHEQFTLTKNDCKLMMKSELQFLSIMRSTQLAKLDKVGANITKLIRR